MNALAWIGETRIAQAVQEGRLDDLPGASRALDLTVRDGALDAQARLGLELLSRARAHRTPSAQDQRERAALRLLWAKALSPQRRNTATSSTSA